MLAGNRQRGSFRVCLETIKFAGTATEEPLDRCVYGSGSDLRHDKVRVQAEMYVSDGYAVGRETKVEASASNNERTITFNDCLDVSEDDAAEELVIEFKERDEQTELSELLCATVKPRPAGCDDGSSFGENCHEFEDLGRCVIDLSQLGASAGGYGSFEQSITIGSGDCQAGVGPRIESGKIKVRTLRSSW